MESTKKKTKSKFCNKKTSIGFILNMIAVCLGVLLAFFLQDCWHKSIDAKNTERILTMTYQELLNNGDYYTALYDNYSILKSVGLVKAKLSSEFAVELLRQNNKINYLTNSEIKILYNYVRAINIVNEYVEYYNRVFQPKLSRTTYNQDARSNIIFTLKIFAADATILKQKLKKYDINRDNDYNKDIEEYLKLKQKYFDDIENGTLEANTIN